MNSKSDEPVRNRPRRRPRAILVFAAGLAGLSATAIFAPALYRESQRQIATDRMRDTLNAIRYTAMERGGALPPATGWEREVGYLEKSESPRMLDSRRVEGPTPDWVYTPPTPQPGEPHATLSEIEQPSEYVLLHEDVSRLPARYTSVIVGMADGSVQMMDRATLEAKLAAQKQAASPVATDGTGGPG